MNFINRVVSFKVKPEWSSLEPQHRQKIRTDILASLSVVNAEAVRRLEEIPNLSAGFISIAHCPLVGGYAWGEMPIGFDIEDPTRVKSAIAARIATPEEFQLSPSPAHLWVAKESAYKALRGPDQPSTVSAVGITWQSTPDHPHSFQFTSEDQTGVGFIVSLHQALAAVACLRR